MTLSYGPYIMYRTVMLLLLSLLVMSGGYSDGEPQTHIVGGWEADVGSAPWQGTLQYNGRNVCGCVLISEVWVVTAAHCLALSANPANYMVVFGVHDRSDNSVGEPFYSSVSEIIKHGNYSIGPGQIPNDIALIQLSSPTNVASQYIDAITLAEPDSNYEGYTATITGWGSTTTGGAVHSNVLREARGDIFQQAYCEQLWGQQYIVNGHVCFGDFAGQISMCSGDSGGPLFLNTGGQNVLVGVASWGEPSCSAYQRPSVYTRISEYRNWIKAITGI